MEHVIKKIVTDTLKNLKVSKDYKTDIEIPLENHTLSGITSELKDISEKYDVNIDSIEIWEDMAVFEVMKEKSEKQYKKDLEKRFERSLWYKVRDTLKSEGYERKGFDSDEYKKALNGKTLLDLAKENNYRSIVDYYEKGFKFIK